MRSRLAGLALLLIAVYCCLGTTRGGNKSVTVPDQVIIKQSAAPTDTTVFWIDSDNGNSYSYYAGEWLGDPQTYLFGRGAVGAAGPLNIGGVAALPSDTTTGAEQGYYIATRARISSISMLSNNSITTPACTAGVYAMRAERKFAWHVQRLAVAGGAGDTVSAGDVLCMYLRASAIPIYPNSTTVVVTLRERVAP